MALELVDAEGRPLFAFQSARSCSNDLRFEPIRIARWDALLDAGKPNLAELTYCKLTEFLIIPTLATAKV